MTPVFQIVAGDEDVTAKIADRLVSLTVTDEDGESADTLTLVIDDRDGVVDLPETDMPLDLSLGYAGAALVPIGRFVVDRLRGRGMPQQLTIDATAANMTSSLRSPRTRGWPNVTLGDMVATIAGEAGLDAVVAKALSQIGWRFIAQTAESDLNLLSRLCRPLDATAKPAGGKLVIAPRGTGTTAAGDPVTPVAIDRSGMESWDWELSERETYTSVTAEWGDLDGGETKEVKAGSGDKTRRLRNVFATRAEAQRAVDGELAMAGRARLKLEVKLSRFHGNLYAGGTVRISGMRNALNGDWLLSKVTHELSGALLTDITAERLPDA